jgi:hypothetical protein
MKLKLNWPLFWRILAILCLAIAVAATLGPQLQSGQGALIMGRNDAAAVAAAAEQYFADHAKLPKSFADLEKHDLLAPRISRVRLDVISPDIIEIQYSGSGNRRNRPRQIRREACRRLEACPDGTLTNTSCYEGIRWWRF